MSSAVRQKKHRARELQMERQESYFVSHMKQVLTEYKVSPRNAKVIMEISLMAYKRGRLDR